MTSGFELPLETDFEQVSRMLIVFLHRFPTRLIFECVFCWLDVSDISLFARSSSVLTLDRGHVAVSNILELVF